MKHLINLFRHYLFLMLFLCCGLCHARTGIVSWNLKDFGHSKSNEEINIIALTLASYDIIAIQEVVAGPGGQQAVARLAKALSSKGEAWGYEVSPVTSGSSAHKAERYAFLWKKSSSIKVGQGWLEKKYGDSIEREPFYARFRSGVNAFTLVNFHAITKSKQPEREIKYFKYLPLNYPTENLIFCGDFNLPQSHSVFNPLKKLGFQPAMLGQKTSLRQQCLKGDCLASEFDNFYFQLAQLNFKSAGLIHFYRRFSQLKDARKISDHVPIFLNIG